MSTKFAAPDGGVTERMLRYYETRAEGGAGLVTIEATAVDRSGLSFARGLDISCAATLDGLAKLAHRVKQHGACVSIQLQHGGRAALPQSSGQAIPLVSFIPGVTPYDNSVILDTKTIAQLITCWSKAAVRAREAGFDMVEIHGAHGYLISQFFSPYTNKRQDEYGGSLENRMRFPLEVCRAVRAAVGKDFPVVYRMSAVEGLPEGISLDDSVTLSRRLVTEGIDALHISVGLRETNFMVSPPACVKRGWNAPLSRAIRDGISKAVPIIVAGRVADEQTAAAILNRGDADMVAMGRALIADPFLPTKVLAGQPESVIRCVGCNEGCVGGSARGTGVGCALNPLTGAEGRYDLSRVAAPRHIVVIGAGPAGMQAALTSRMRGHHVDLYEKTDQLGGLVNLACKPPYKEDLCTLTTNFALRLKQSGVQVHFGTEVTAVSDVVKNADVVLVATGSTPVFPRFCRDTPAVVAEKILSGAVRSGKRALVMGGGLIGCETADFLTQQGVEVCIVELQPELAKDMESRTRHYTLLRLQEHGTQYLTNTQILEITPEGRVRIKNSSGTEDWLETFDTLVVAVGYRSETDLAARLEAEACPVIRIGDCAHVGTIMTAIANGFQVGCNIY